MNDLKKWVLKERLQADIFPIPDSPFSPLFGHKRNQPQTPIHYAISLFPSLVTPCPKQLKEVLVPKEVKDFLLALNQQNFVPLLAGFLPSPFHHFLKKRCLEYKREIETIRIELLVVVSRMISFKLAASNLFSQTLANMACCTGDFNGSNLNTVSHKKVENINSLMGFSGDKDSDHCDRLKRFRDPSLLS